jgi:hypothetical protein
MRIYDYDADREFMISLPRNNGTLALERLVGVNGTTGLIKNGSAVTSTSGLTACPIISGVPYYKDTDTNTTYSAGTGLQLSGTTFSTKLNSTTSLGTIGTTSKLYAVGVDANGKLCVNVPWTDTDTNT